MLGENIQLFRKSCGMSQKQLSETLGLSLEIISAWEDNEQVPCANDIVALAKIFGTTTDDLLGLSIQKQAVSTSPTLQTQQQTSTNCEFSEREIVCETDVPQPHSSNKRRKIVIILISALAFLSLILGAFFYVNYKNQQRLENAEKAVVKVVCYDPLDNIIASGSGFFFESTSRIITNYHVIRDAYRISVITYDENNYDIDTVRFVSEEMDIAELITYDFFQKTFLEPSPTTQEKGDEIYAIGSPLGINNTLSKGIVSGNHMVDDISAIQFTAPISSGSSGGVLLNKNGFVLGMTFASYQDGQNLNLAIPIGLITDALSNSYKHKTKSIRAIYIDNHPYAADLLTFGSKPPVVSIQEIKSNAFNYTDQLYAFKGVVSSVRNRTVGGFCYMISDGSLVTGNFEKDAKEYINTGIKSSPFIWVNAVTYGEDDIQGNLQTGDEVWIIGLNPAKEQTTAPVFQGLLIYNETTAEYFSCLPSFSKHNK